MPDRAQGLGHAPIYRCVSWFLPTPKLRAWMWRSSSTCYPNMIEPSQQLLALEAVTDLACCCLFV